MQKVTTLSKAYDSLRMISSANGYGRSPIQFRGPHSLAGSHGGPTHFRTHSGLLLYWLVYRERVPITGRQQFQCMGHATRPPKGGEHTIGVSQGIMKYLLTTEDPRASHTKSVMDRILLTNGLDDLRWILFVLDNPCKYLIGRALVHCLSYSLYRQKPSDMQQTKPKRKFSPVVVWSCTGGYSRSQKRTMSLPRS